MVRQRYVCGDTGCLWLFIIGSSMVPLLAAFNIDVTKAVIYRVGSNDIGFGHAVEFIDNNNNIGLLVTAPRLKVDDWFNNSGIYYQCSSPLDPQVRCIRKTSMPHNVTGNRSDSSGQHYGEYKEYFGMSLLMVNRSTPVMCGPLWSHPANAASDQRGYTFIVGRCVLNSRESFAPYFQSFPSQYIVNSQMINGYAMFGFAAGIDEEGHMVFTAPGYTAGHGGLVAYDNNFKNQTMFTDRYGSQQSVYLGYATVVGNFCGGNRFCFALSDRKENATVYLLEKDKSYINLLYSLHSSQVYSSFGASLCAMDINGDGWSDLFVGAPLFTEMYQYDQGQVHVYLNTKVTKVGQVPFQEIAALSGERKIFSRFGSAISSIGDINRDSFSDIAIGAPLDDDGKGAVYIYLGGSQGPVQDKVQKITASSIRTNPPLTSFGHHISKSTSQLNIYQYPEFAVGCPQSGTVVVLRTRPIVNIKVQIEARPNVVEHDNPCPNGMNPQLVDGSGCIAVSLCFLTEVESIKLIENIYIDYSLTVDRNIGDDSRRRVRLYKPGNTVTTTEESATLRLTNENSTCKNYTAILKMEQINRNPFRPVELWVNFNLNTTLFTGAVPPILNQSLPNNAMEEVIFKNKCGSDQKCEANLKLNGTIHHIPELPNLMQFNVVNHTKTIELHLFLTNTGETAYGIQFTINKTDSTRFRLATDLGSGSHYICNDTDKSKVTCNNWAPLSMNGLSDINLVFDVISVPLRPEYSSEKFQVLAMPYDHRNNPETDLIDNDVELDSAMRIVADLSLSGLSSPREVNVYETDNPTMTLTHKITVINRGPSFLPSTHLNVSIPYLKHGSDILSRTNVKIKYENGTQEECPAIFTSDEVILTTTIATTTDSTLSTSSDASPETSTENLEEVPVNRRRRQASANMEPTNNVQRIDCQTYRCYVFRCPLPSLEVDQNSEVTLNITLLVSELPFTEKVNDVTYLTTVHVTQPNHPLFYPWTKSKTLQVPTRIYQLSSKGDINIWIIIGGVLAGLLLLILITVLAWKLGFFKREGKQELKRMKRESGYYNRNKGNMKHTNPDDTTNMMSDEKNAG